ncbi:MAG: hypothetical protein QMD50_01160 [Patescibacteria group bacterium]|nr:hypothetical protein [Patescibacteria group bacterium]
MKQNFFAIFRILVLFVLVMAALYIYNADYKSTETINILSCTGEIHLLKEAYSSFNVSGVDYQIFFNHCYKALIIMPSVHDAFFVGIMSDGKIDYTRKTFAKFLTQIESIELKQNTLRVNIDKDGLFFLLVLFVCVILSYFVITGIARKIFKIV